MNVLVLFGGKSFEHEVSIKSAKSILENIDYDKFQVTPVGISKENRWFIYDDSINNLDHNWLNRKTIPIDNIISFLKKFDVVFPITHGNYGEDGKLQGLLDMFDIKYVGSKTLASSIGMDKEMSKIVFNHLNIPQIPYISFVNNYDIKEIESKLTYPIIVKPANGGSSIGISIANTQEELITSIESALKYDDKIIVENFIKARELECAILDTDEFVISDIGEIKSCNKFYDYDAKYKNNSETFIANDLDDSIIKQIKKYAKCAFHGINAKNLARVDFLYDEQNNNLYLNEINTLPGFTQISMYPKLLINNSFSYQDLITKLIENC